MRSELQSVWFRRRNTTDFQTLCLCLAPPIEIMKKVLSSGLLNNKRQIPTIYCFKHQGKTRATFLCRHTIKFISKQMFEILQALNKGGVVRNTDEPNQSLGIENKINCDLITQVARDFRRNQSKNILWLLWGIASDEWVEWVEWRREGCLCVWCNGRFNQLKALHHKPARPNKIITQNTSFEYSWQAIKRGINASF